MKISITAARKIIESGQDIPELRVRPLDPDGETILRQRKSGSSQRNDDRLSILAAVIGCWDNLTARQRQVLDCRLSGMTVAGTARSLRVSATRAHEIEARLLTIGRRHDCYRKGQSGLGKACTIPSFLKGTLELSSTLVGNRDIENLCLWRLIGQRWREIEFCFQIPNAK